MYTGSRHFGFARLGAAGAAAALVAACGAEGDFAAESPPGADAGMGDDQPACQTSSECPTGMVCTDFGTCVPPGEGQDAGLPAEVEFEFSTPRSSLRYVYVAMPELDALAKIDGETLEVSTVTVGRRPEVVAAAPGSDTAVSLDPENATAAIVRPSDGGDETRVVPTLPGLNAVEWDPTGRFAVAYFDLAKALSEAGELDPIGDVGSLQDVTVIERGEGGEPDRTADMTVGFQPRSVSFDEGGQFAYVVTSDGVSAIDLRAAIEDGPALSVPIPITGDPFADPDDFEVQVVPSGEYAVVRESERAEVAVISLASDSAGAREVVPLSAAPTDIELDPDSERAYAVLRDSAELAVIDLAKVAGADETAGEEGVTIVELDAERRVGSLALAPDGERGVLFTNAEVRREITFVELGEPPYEVTTHPLEKAVRAVSFSPSGETALVIHSKQPGDPGEAESQDEFLARSYGYSVLHPDSGFSRLEITPVDPGPFAFAEDRPLAYVALDGGDAEDAVRKLHEIDLDSFVIRHRDLASPPEAVGILTGADAVFVAQRHPLGRVSFLDPDEDAMRTLTGFDLDGRIVE